MIIKKNCNSCFVGLFWADMKDGKVYADKIPVEKALIYGEFRIHPLGHYDVWNKMFPRNPRWDGWEYEDIPRGRVGYKVGDKKPFHIFACPLCKKPDIKSAIAKEFNLPMKHCIFDFTDEHYVLRDIAQD